MIIRARRSPNDQPREPKRRTVRHNGRLSPNPLTRYLICGIIREQGRKSAREKPGSRQSQKGDELSDKLPRALDNTREALYTRTGEPIMKTNQSTPSPEHDQSQEPIFPDRSCKSCASGVGILYPDIHGRWEPRIYCHLLGRACKATLVGCSYWTERPTHGH